MSDKTIAELKTEFNKKEQELLKTYKNLIVDKFNSILSEVGMLDTNVVYSSKHHRNNKDVEGKIDIILHGYCSVIYDIIFRPIKKDGTYSSNYLRVYEMEIYDEDLKEKLLTYFEPVENQRKQCEAIINKARNK